MVSNSSRVSDDRQFRRIDPCSNSDSHFSLAHIIELEVQRKLLSHPDCQFHSLVVHRFEDGICLQGVVVGDPTDAVDICKIAEEVTGVHKVVNRLIFQQSPTNEIPPKG